MMSTCVFLGPTLAVADAAKILHSTFLPPVRQGDVYRVVSQQRPCAIGIVDGYFQWVPAVWHKEILWAIDQGVHVFGAASMGALRAAELAPFGMRGVGCIFKAYREGRFPGPDDGPFEDDDEVAVVHGPAESGYRGGSEAMVNMRCTLAKAAHEGVITEPTRRVLVAEAKAAFFPDRSYAHLLAYGRVSGLPEHELMALVDWLPHGRVDQKRADALAMLTSISEFLAMDLPPAKASFTFERTVAWHNAETAFRASAEHRAAALLAALRIDTADCEHLGEEQLRDWYFRRIAGTAVPADFAGWMRNSGYTDSEEFHHAVFVEYLRQVPGPGGRP
jgi:hypothetical protein